MNVLFDTNIYIYHSQGDQDIIELFERYEDWDVIVPTVQITELLGHYKLSHDPEKMTEFVEHIARAKKISLLDEPIAYLAAELRREAKRINGKSIKTPDSILASTALLLNALFISNNDKDFLLLRDHFGLQYFNPLQQPQAVPHTM
jgi:predicted nucleic acid-binding protein